MRANHAHLLHFINQSSCSGITKAQTSLQQRGGCLSCLYHNLNSFRHHWIAAQAVIAGFFLVGFIAFCSVLFNLFNYRLIVLCIVLGFHEFYNLLYFLIIHKTALHTLWFHGAGRGKQHIASSQQFLRAGAVQDGTGVDLRRYRKSNSAWNIGFDYTGNNVYGWALCCNNQVHSGGTSHLRQAANGILYFIWRSHHQVRQLINNNHDLRHWLQLYAVLTNHAIAYHFVISVQVTHVVIRKGFIAIQHFRYRPSQGTGSLSGIGYNRHQQMRNPVINTQLYYLWVYHQELYFIGRSFIQQTDNQGVDTHRFTGTGCAGNQQVRHFCKVCQGNLSGNISSQCHRQSAFSSLKGCGFNQFPHLYHTDIFIRHLYTHGCLTGNRRFNSHTGGCQVHGDIIRQVGNLTDFHTGCRLQLIPCYGRATADI